MRRKGQVLSEAKCINKVSVGFLPVLLDVSPDKVFLNSSSSGSTMSAHCRTGLCSNTDCKAAKQGMRYDIDIALGGLLGALGAYGGGFPCWLSAYVYAPILTCLPTVEAVAVLTPPQSFARLKLVLLHRLSLCLHMLCTPPDHRCGWSRLLSCPLRIEQRI